MITITHEIKLIGYSVVCESESYASGYLLLSMHDTTDSLHIVCDETWKDLALTITFENGAMSIRAPMDHNGMVVIPKAIFRKPTPPYQLGKIVFSGNAPNARRIAVSLPYRVSFEAGQPQGGQREIVSADTHYDFPAEGSGDMIYRAVLEKKLYQWNTGEGRYEPLDSGSIESVKVIYGGTADGID